MIKFIKEFTLKRLEEEKFYMENGYAATIYVDNIHYELYKTTSPFSNTKDAKEQLLEYDVFKAIDKVVNYEKCSFGEIYTDIVDAKKLANMLVYILGEEFINNTDIYSRGGETVTIEHINHLIENIDRIE